MHMKRIIKTVAGFLFGLSHAIIIAVVNRLMDLDPKLAMILLLGFLANVAAALGISQVVDHENAGNN